MKKLFALLLALLMVAAVFVACDDTTEDTSSTASKPSTSNSGNTSGSGSTTVIDECWLPEKNWDVELVWASNCSDDEEARKKEIGFLEIWCDEDYGDNISKAVYERSNWLRDTYGITIKMLWNPEGGVNAFAQQCSTSGEKLDVVSTSFLNLAPGFQGKYYHDLRVVNKQYNNGQGWIKFEEDYYDQTSMAQLSINHKLFAVTGDLLLREDEETWVMFANLDLLEEQGISDIYEIVENKEWNLDKLIEICTAFSKPDPSVGTMKYDPTTEEQWGIVSQGVDTLMFMLGFGQPMISKSEDTDLPSIRIEEERNVDVAQKFIGFIANKNIAGFSDLFGHWQTYNPKASQFFANGKAIFMPQRLAYLTSNAIANADFKVGVVPMPLFDDLQEDYSSSCNVYGLYSVAIPTANKDNVEAVLYAIEAMSWYGKKYVRPEYYEKTIKLQKLDDPRAEAILDKIFNNRTYDMACLYNWGDMVQFYNTLASSGSTDVVSHYGKKKFAYQSAIDKAVADFQKQ